MEIDSNGVERRHRVVATVRRILRRLEFHFVPKHASWLNMVEIEIGVLRAQRQDRRIAERRRNAAGARITCIFTAERARKKMGHAYPDTTPALANAA